MDIAQIAEGIRSSYRWNSNTVTYSFKDSVASYDNSEDSTNLQVLSTVAKNAVHEIMSEISSYLDIDLVYTSGIGDIALSAISMDRLTLGYSYLPTNPSTSIIKDNTGDIYLNSSFTDNDYQKGAMGYSTIIHELGHALGLLHPFDDGYYEGVDINDTVMSYNYYEGYDDITNNSYSIYSFSSYMEADIIALQAKYGASDTYDVDNSYILSDILYSSIDSGYVQVTDDNVHSIYDSDGTDTIDLTDMSVSYIDLNGTKQSVVVYGDIHHYVNLLGDIENISGSSSDDIIVLNSANNSIDGNSGNDKVYISSSDDLRVDYDGESIYISSSSTGLDVLTDIEELYINDSLVTLSTYQKSRYNYSDQKADDMGRLYLSVFNRLADKEGLDYWLSDYNSGNSMTNIAASFILSDEFVSTYGSNISDNEYINLLYNNVLYRDADSSGLSYWSDEMQNGFSKAEVLASFANSEEFVELTSIYFADGNILVS
jgi:hypothetical protein